MLLLLLACAPKPADPHTAKAPAVVDAAEAPAGPRLAGLDFPGDPAVADASRDVLALILQLHPDLAADAGLLADGLHVPTFSAEAVAAQLADLDAAEARLAAIPADGLPVADRIDLALLTAAVASAQHARRVEKRWEHRPAEWLEPVGTLLVSHTGAAEPLPGAIDTLAAQIPGMLDEMRAAVTAPTARDVETALGLLDGIGQALRVEATPEHTGAADAVDAYRSELAALTDLPEMRMIGAEAYRWRLEHGLLLTWTAEGLLAHAEAELVRVEAEIADLEARVPPQAPPTAEEEALAEGLDQAGVLALYDAMVARDLAALRGMDVVTVPDDLPPLRARPTPATLIPLTGDGGSMNPVTPFGPSEGAWWNVENYKAPDYERRLGTVVTMSRHHETWFGPYAVHEGVPGHHLQLAISRDNPRPVRKLLQSSPSAEGWALYAEALFEENGGFGGTEVGRLVMLRSYRARIKRVVFSVRVETGEWSLQEAADWKHRADPGTGWVDPELLRTVQWPTQLIGYYAGRAELVALKEEVKAAWGEDYSERAFHDAVLAEGPIPISLIRVALLAE